MLVGHKNQWNFLVKAAELDRLSHAYLFSGQDKLGKKKLAIEFVKFLNCFSNNIQKKPCGICRSCRDIQKGVHPDFIFIKPKGPGFDRPKRITSGKEIQISQIRELIWKLSLRPYSSTFKVAILDRAHLMTQEAQSCFLKLLEEPKGRAILILITEYSGVLLPTILSRVQRIRFSPVKSTEIENYLKGQGISEDKAKHISAFSFGKPGLAIDFLLDSQKLESQKKLILDLVKISNSEMSFRFQYAKDLLNAETENLNNLREILDTWLRYFRKIFLFKIRGKESFGKQGAAFNPFQKYSLSKLKKIIRLIQSINFLLTSTNINPKLALEILFMEI